MPPIWLLLVVCQIPKMRTTPTPLSIIRLPGQKPYCILFVPQEAKVRVLCEYFAVFSMRKAPCEVIQVHLESWRGGLPFRKKIYF
jgi:hypothetical protein